MTTQDWCRWCGQPIHFSTCYDEPHWVHDTTAAVMACPSGAQAVVPA